MCVFFLENTGGQQGTKNWVDSMGVTRGLDYKHDQIGNMFPLVLQNLSGEIINCNIAKHFLGWRSLSGNEDETAK